MFVIDKFKLIHFNLLMLHMFLAGKIILKRNVFYEQTRLVKHLMLLNEIQEK